MYYVWETALQAGSYLRTQRAVGTGREAVFEVAGGHGELFGKPIPDSL